MKLDFNERSDGAPQWLRNYAAPLETLWRYPDRAAGEAEVAAALSVSTGQVLLSNGGDEAIEWLFKRATLQGTRLVIPEPCFSQYQHGATVWPCQVVFVPARVDLGVDLDAAVATLEAGDCLVLTRPNNPTGECLPEVRIEWALAQAKAREAEVFLDEAYVDFAPNPDASLAWIERWDHLSCLRSFSKSFGLAGARLGCLVGAAARIETWRRLAMPFNVSALNMAALSLALANRSEVRFYCASIADNRARLFDWLTQCGVPVFDGRGNFLLLRLNTRRKVLLDALCRAAGLAIKTELAGLPDAVRITVPLDTAVLESVLERALRPVWLGFDMDGVLIDTRDSYDACVQQTVQGLGGEAVSDNDIQELRRGGGYNNDWDLTRRLLAQQNIECTRAAVIEHFQTLYRGATPGSGLQAREKPLLGEALKTRLQAGQHRVAVITGRPRIEAEEGLQLLGLDVAALVSLDDVQRAKPDPEGVLLALQGSVVGTEGQAQRENAWYIGDNVDDMQAGAAAGCVCIGIGGGEKTPALLQAGAHIVLPSVNALEDLL